MAILIIGQLALGFYMVDLPSGLQKIELIGWHKEIGVCILLLVTLRLAWRMRNISPLPPKHTPYWQQLAATGVHYLLYAVIFALPLTGWLLSSAAGHPVSFFGFFVLPGLISPNKHLAFLFFTAHQWLAFGLMGLLVVHVGAVFYHYVFYKHNILRRIFP
ncbi:MAG: cytochrome b [Alphaproteobacteria bacterium]|nr:cytochrome b [Alphaproteobacteria bacterium]